MRVVLFILPFLMLFFTFSCSKKEQAAQKNLKSKTKKVCLALGYTGSGDNAFNDIQYNGLVKAASLYPIKIDYGMPKEDTEEGVLTLIKELIQTKNCDFMITSGYLAIEPINTIAPQYPNIRFALLDEIAKKAPNVVSVVFSENEGSFLVGYLAGKVSKTKKVVFLGGVNIEPVENFLIGFKEGVRYANPLVKIKTHYLSKIPDFSGFINPNKGYQKTQEFYNQGADIVYAVAGGSNNGIIQAAKEEQKWVIGVDSDQDFMAPGLVLTSMMKRLDVAIINLCQKLIENKLELGKVVELNLAQGGVSLSPMQYTRFIIPEKTLQELEKLKKDIINKKIKIKSVRD